MNNSVELERIFFDLGKSDAQKLRVEAKDMTGTEIINEEIKIPKFVQDKDYSKWPVGSPVKCGGQVWTLIQPYNSKAHPGNPSELRALWSLCHTKNSKRAKAWVEPQGISGLYLMDECYKDENGKIWRCKVEQTNFDAKEWPQGWEEVIL